MPVAGWDVVSTHGDVALIGAVVAFSGAVVELILTLTVVPLSVMLT